MGSHQSQRAGCVWFTRSLSHIYPSLATASFKTSRFTNRRVMSQWPHPSYIPYVSVYGCDCSSEWAKSRKNKVSTEHKGQPGLLYIHWAHYEKLCVTGTATAGTGVQIRIDPVLVTYLGENTGPRRRLFLCDQSCCECLSRTAVIYMFPAAAPPGATSTDFL